MQDRQVNTLAEINDFFSHQRLALVGVSRDEKGFGRQLMRELARRGFDILPVNPAMSEVDGRRCFKSLMEIDPPPEAAMLMTGADHLPQLAKECALTGVRFAWVLRSGGDRTIRSNAIRILRENLITTIDGLCPYMFLPESGMPHSLHRRIVRLFGRYPH